MAKKRLNKKVVFIGSALLLVFAIVGIFLVLSLSKDPEKYVKDAEMAWANKNYKVAEINYAKAIEYTKDNTGKLDLLFKMVDMFYENQDWVKVRGYWERIVKIDSDNITARLGLISYMYAIADSGEFTRAWQEILSQSNELLGVLEKTNQLNENIDKWPSFEILKYGFTKKIGAYVYMLRGRAVLELVKMGAVTDQQKSLDGAITDLEKFQEFEPNNIDSFWYLAQSINERGNLLAATTGTVGEKNQAEQLAVEQLEKAVEVAKNNPKAYINLLTMKLDQIAYDDISSMEPEFLSLEEKFPSDADVQAAIAEFYLRQGFENIDKAINFLEKARELDKQNIGHALRLAVLHYRKFSIDKMQEKSSPSDIYDAIKIANEAVSLLGDEGKPGPRYYEQRKNRISLYMFLAKCYIEQLIEPCEERNDAQQQELKKNAEQIVYKIEQFYDSGEQTDVIKWNGMLAFAEGNTEEAARKLYVVQKRLEAAGRKDIDVSYTLAEIYKNSSEIGAVREFLEIALDAKKLKPAISIAQSKPLVILDYADVLLKLQAWQYAMSNIEMFDNRFGTNNLSRMLAVKANVGEKQFEKAEEILAQLDQDDPDTINLYIELLQAKIDKHTMDMLQKENAQPDTPPDVARAAELKNYKDELAKMAVKLLDKEPKDLNVAVVVKICNNYISDNQTALAKDLVDDYLKYFPDNTTAMFYKQLLAEPESDINNISQARRQEIEESVLSNIADPVLRGINLGAFYKRADDPIRAIAELKKVFNVEDILADLKNKPIPDSLDELEQTDKTAARYLFDLGIENDKLDLAEQITNIARYKNIDDCRGKFLEARLNTAKKEYDSALANLDICIQEKPIFSYAYMLRSNVNSILGNQVAAIEDAKTAAKLNPMDGKIAKGLVDVLYQRNQKLGENVGAEQAVEFKAVLDRAMALNRNDLQLMSFYAEFIFSEEPDKAMAIRQHLQSTFPSFNNALLLGKMAMKRAKEVNDATNKKAFLEISASAFAQAKAIEPQNQDLLRSYTEYLQLVGKGSEAVDMLSGSEDKTMLFAYYMQEGKYQDANELMLQLYQQDNKNPVAIKGLLLAAEKNSDRQAVQRYSQELLAVEGEDTVENELFQIQTYLKLGLIKEAELKIQSFKEKNPDEKKVLMLEAWLAMKQGLLEKAITLTNRVLEGDQRNAIAWRLRGEINFLTGDYDKALSDLNQSNIISDNSATRIMMARVYMSINKNDDAIRELNGAIKLPEASLDARMLLEQIYLKLGKTAELKQFYEETLEKFDNSMYWYNQTGTFAVMIKDYKTAEKMFQQAWQGGKKGTKQDKENAFNGYLQALLLQGKVNEAFDEAQKYVDSEFASIAFIAIAEAKSKTSDKQAVMGYCQKAIDKASGSEAVKSWVLKKMYALIGTEEMLKYYQDKLKENPDSLMANYIIFDLMKASGQYNRALTYIDKCMQIVGTDTEQASKYTVSKVMVLQSAYAKTYDKNYLRQAISEYESLLEKMPNNINVLNNLAYLLAESNERLEDALEYSKQAYKLMPNNSNFLDTYSYVLYKNGQYEEAEKFLRAAEQQYNVDKVPVPAEVYEHLGMIEEKLGKKAEAVSAYKQALEVGNGTMPKSVEDRINRAIESLL